MDRVAESEPLLQPTAPATPDLDLPTVIAAARANRIRRVSLLLAIIVAALLEVALFARIVVAYANGNAHHKDIAFYVLGPAALTASVTTFVIIVLFRAGRRRLTTKWTRVTVQIRILVLYAVCWAIIASLITYLPEQCPHKDESDWAGTCSGLYTTTLVLNWIFIDLLLIAAYATYFRAKLVHGTNLVRHPEVRMIAAWRLAEVEDGTVQL
ncbi:hypothetical protein MIND_00143100 [Mycena indigotica]|uniref:Uncharacterized protein n=1 Tax=Mycena indigotica TaxID=2126181 RepID=A0A8H6TEW9_9AGAR|nr:uncharacterized protein MIND_00143100 [Mycena indigotica]KAF7316245.1 hypothetical protein MIND_00143100 [Mycena indigotica]